MTTAQLQYMENNFAVKHYHNEYTAIEYHHYFKGITSKMFVLFTVTIKKVLYGIDFNSTNFIVAINKQDLLNERLIDDKALKPYDYTPSGLELNLGLLGPFAYNEYFRKYENKDNYVSNVEEFNKYKEKYRSMYQHNIEDGGNNISMMYQEEIINYYISIVLRINSEFKLNQMKTQNADDELKRLIRDYGEPFPTAEAARIRASQKIKKSGEKISIYGDKHRHYWYIQIAGQSEDKPYEIGEDVKRLSDYLDGDVLHFIEEIEMI